jgi:hypothetical protein
MPEPVSPRRLFGPPSLGAGLRVGLVFGLLLSLPLLVMGLRGGEFLEGAGLMSGVAGLPVSLVVFMIPWLTRGSMWALFVLINVLVNCGLLGMLVGASAQRLDPPSRWWPAALPVLWLAVVTLTYWFLGP